MDTDFLVIGGGIAGCAAGAALADLGRVVLWEGEGALAYHASGRSAALFEEQYGLPETIALNRASAAAHHGGGYTAPRGLMFVATQGQGEMLARDVMDMHLAPLTLDEAQAMVPILNPGTFEGAGYHEGAWDLDTDRMVQDSARAIRAAGGAVEVGRVVTGIERLAGGWRIVAGTVEITARVLVNAAGAWADAVAGIAGVAPLGLTPLRRSVARIAAPEGRDVTRWPMLIGAGETWYAKPDAGAWLVSPAEEDPHPAADVYADDMVLAEGLARYQDAVVPEVTRPISTWAGLRTFTPDRRLALGPERDDDSFIWVAGQGGYGFQTAPAAAQLVADRVAGRASELPVDVVAALDPARFRA